MAALFMAALVHGRTCSWPQLFMAAVVDGRNFVATALAASCLTLAPPAWVRALIAFEFVSEMRRRVPGQTR
jgi:hypothetical protein